MIKATERNEGTKRNGSGLNINSANRTEFSVSTSSTSYSTASANSLTKVSSAFRMNQTSAEAQEKYAHVTDTDSVCEEEEQNHWLGKKSCPATGPTDKDSDCEEEEQNHWLAKKSCPATETTDTAIAKKKSKTV